MTRAVVLCLLLAGCVPDSEPAPKKCSDCKSLCAPFPVFSCEPIQFYESGRVPYDRCVCVRPAGEEKS